MRILVIDDSRVDADLIGLAIQRGVPGEVEIESAPSLAAGVSKLKDEEFDATILDLRLPESRLEEGLLRLRQVDEHVPIIVLTGLDCDENHLAPRLLREGAQDFIRKDEVTSFQLHRVIRNAIHRQNKVNRLKANLDTEAQLRREIVHLSQLLDQEKPAKTPPLRERHPEMIENLLKKYCDLTELLVKTRSKGMALVDTSEAATFANELGKLKANSHDVIDLHLDCVGRFEDDKSGGHLAWLQEARIALVIMLGHLVRFYRRSLH